MAYSADLRNKALNYYEQCKNISQTAATFNLSRNTLYLWIRLCRLRSRRCGGVCSTGAGGGGRIVGLGTPVEGVGRHIRLHRGGNGGYRRCGTAAKARPLPPPRATAARLPPKPPQAV